jgi:DNA-binding LacI/PurR family transcriptional regulator
MHSFARGTAMRISIKDIARAAGVSHSTVSRALSDSSLVSNETRVKIKSLAHEMGYSPNALARGLVTSHTYTIGVVVTSIADPFAAEIVQGIETTAQDNGYSVILTNSGSQPDRELQAVETLREKQVDGVIVTASRIGALYASHLERTGRPVVLVNNHNEQSGRYVYSVTVDNNDGGFCATEYLLHLGHRRIAYVSAPPHHSSDQGRFRGYLDALGEYNVIFDPQLVIQGDGQAEGGKKALIKLMTLASRPTAVFCYNDMTAVGLMHSAHQIGLRIPEDLSVIGFDDIPFATYVNPSLTTIAQPKQEMGQMAMQIMLQLITARAIKEDLPTSSVIVKGHLVVRSSAKALNPAKAAEYINN